MILQSPTLSGSVNISGSLLLNGGPIAAEANIITASTFTDTFTSVTSKVATHEFGTKDVIVQVYNVNDQIIIPASVTTNTVDQVTITFPTPISGRIVVAKGGHIVSGVSSNAISASFASSALTSVSSSFANTSTTSTSSSFAATTLSAISSSFSNTSLSSLNSISASYSHTASLANNALSSITSSYSTTAEVATLGNTVYETRAGGALTFWQGTQAQYDALGSYSTSTIYFID